MSRKHIRQYAKGQMYDHTNAGIEDLIRQGKIEREGIWYQVNDLQVLRNEFFGHVKRMFVNKQKTLVQLYSQV